MILVQKGQKITSTANEDEFLPLEPDDNGDLVPAGRTEFIFTWVSGSVQIAVGTPVNTSNAVALAAAGDRRLLTISPQAGEGGYRNGRIVGAGVVAIDW